MSESKSNKPAAKKTAAKKPAEKKVEAKKPEAKKPAIKKTVKQPAVEIIAGGEVSMKLNTLSPTPGSKHSSKRVGRGIGSTLGKTCGKGHKGQKSRSGGYHKVGFEGGQMPLQRRIPKFGFTSKKALTRAELSLRTLEKIANIKVIDLNILKSSGLVSDKVNLVKVISSGTISKPVNLKGLKVTPGARKLIEAAGGTITE